MPHADIDGARLYWESSGEGEPLLLIQGLGFSAAMWFRLVPFLERHYRVIRYDARGIGRSDTPPGPYPIERAAADAAAVLDAAGEASAHVFACSLGGLVAQELTLAHPDRVRSLQLCCTHAGGDALVPPEQAVLDMLTYRFTLPYEEAIRASIPFAYAPGTDPAIIEEDIKLRFEVRTENEGYTHQLMGAAVYQGSASRLHEVSVPTLVITGDLDRMVPPANSDVLVAAISGARKVVIPGGGHVVFTDHPDAVAASMLEFLDEVGAIDAHR